MKHGSRTEQSLTPGFFMPEIVRKEEILFFVVSPGKQVDKWSECGQNKQSELEIANSLCPNIRYFIGDSRETGDIYEFNRS